MSKAIPPLLTTLGRGLNLDPEPGKEISHGKKVTAPLSTVGGEGGVQGLGEESRGVAPDSGVPGSGSAATLFHTWHVV